jgi:hypothetical protein
MDPNKIGPPDLTKKDGTPWSTTDITKDIPHLAALDITLRSAIDMRNVALKCFHQREIDDIKRLRDGKGIVAEKLNSPCRFYRRGDTIPSENAVMMNYEKFDCSQPFNKWNPMWTTYNMSDNYLALALLEHVGVKLVEREGLTENAEMTRHVRGYLAHMIDHKPKKDRTMMTDQDLRPLADWFEGRGTRTLGPEPLLFRKDGDPMFCNLSKTVNNMRRTERYDIVDKYQVDSGTLARYEKAMGLPFEGWRADASMSHHLTPGPMFPHLCGVCGMMTHRKQDIGGEGCVSKNMVECVYGLCLERGDHKIGVCPKLNRRCTGCADYGHATQDHAEKSPVRLKNECMVAAQLGAITSRLMDTSMAFKMNPRGSNVVIIEATIEIPPSKRFRAFR